MQSVPEVGISLRFRIWEWLKAELERAWRLGIISMVTSIAFVQGASLISQFVLARFLFPDEFAIVRVVENLLRLLIIPAMAGIPTAMVKFVAARRDEREQAQLLGHGIAFSGFSSLALGLLTYLAIPFVLRDPLATRYASILIWTVCPTAVARTVIAFYQGRKQIQRLAGYNAGVVTISLVSTIGGAILWGLEGWAIGRFVGEVLALVGLVLPVRKIIAFVLDRQRLVQMATFGGLASVSHLLDRTVQMSDVILLTRSGISTTEVGTYGLAALLITALGLPAAAVMAAVFPIVAEQPSVQASWSITRRLLWRVAMSTLGICVVAYWLMPTVVRFIWGEAYAPTIRSFRLLLGWFFLNSILTVIGTFFFGIGKPQYSVVGNTLGLGVYFGLSAWLVPTFGVVGIAGLLTLTSLVRGGVFAIFAWWGVHEHDKSCRI